MLVTAGVGNAKQAYHRGKGKAEADQRDDNDAEGYEQDQVAIGKCVATGKRERQRQRRGQRHRAAHAGKRQDERPLPRWRRIALAQRTAHQAGKIGSGIDPGEPRDDDDDSHQCGHGEDLIERKGLRFLVQQAHLKACQKEQ